MPAKKVLMLTIPLFPYLQSSARKPQKTVRIRPADALDLKKTLKEIRKNEIADFNIGGKHWSLVSVFSSYSPDIHVMLIETSPNRYISGPEKIGEREGDGLMGLWAEILNSIAKRKTVASIHAGYNWSPRSWGKEEEKTGFQSLPTKWHPHLWGWPAFEKIPRGGAWSARKVKTASLSPEERRLLGDNNYAKPFGMLIKKRMRGKFAGSGLFGRIFPFQNWRVDGRGIYIRFDESVVEVLKTPGFFGEVLKPLAVILEEIMRGLTEALTTVDCGEIDRVLAKTGRKSRSEGQILRATPVMREEEEIRGIFKSRGYPAGILEAILQPVSNRCREKGNTAEWWRKGFAYALVFNGPSKAGRGELRIMPGVFVGPGGVVEAEGFFLRRPEDRKFSNAEIRRKSEDLRNLAEGLKMRGFR
jgi:hypothetical protein